MFLPHFVAEHSVPHPEEGHVPPSEHASHGESSVTAGHGLVSSSVRPSPVMSFPEQPVKTSMLPIKVRGDSTSYWIKPLSDEHGRFKLHVLDPETGAPVDTGKVARADGGGYEFPNGPQGEGYTKTIAVPDSNQHGAPALSAGGGEQGSVVQQLGSSSSAGINAEQADELNQNKALAESKGFVFPSPPFVRENRDYQKLHDAAYKNIADLLRGGDEMHHVTQVYIELRGILGRKRDAIQVNSAREDGVYKLDVGQSQYLLHKDWRIPFGITHKEFAFPSQGSMPWLKWKGWKEVPSKYQNYFNLIEGRKAEFEKQIETYTKNPPRSYNDVVEFRAKRQKELDDVIKKYVEDKKLRRQQYVWRRNSVVALAAGLGVVLTVERIISMVAGNKSGSGDSNNDKNKSY